MADSPVQPTVADATFAPFRLAWRLAGALLLMWFTHAALQIAYVHLQKVEPSQHLQGQLDYYIPRSDPAGLAAQMADRTGDLLVHRLHVQRLLPSPTELAEARRDTRVGSTVRRSFGRVFQGEVLTVLFATVLFAAKLGIVVTMAPVFLIWMVAFAVDGWVERHIRRACGGRESATIYHRAKLYGTKLLPTLTIVVFLCAPIGLHPALVFLPATLIFALLVRLQISYYKKYL